MSLRKPINQYCKSCTYDSAVAGTWRAQVGNCTVTSCPLWNVRPRPLSHTRKKPTKLKEVSDDHADDAIGALESCPE